MTRAGDQPRSAEEISEAADRFVDRLWAVRSERRPMSAYDQGWLDGVVQALRWAGGDGDRVEDASLDT